MVYNVTIEKLKQDTEGKKQQFMKQKCSDPRFSPILSKKKCKDTSKIEWELWSQV